MKNVIFLIYILSFCMIFAECKNSNNADSSPILSYVQGLSDVAPGGDSSPYYTSDTISAAKEYARQTGGTDILAGLDRKLFIKGSRLEILSQKRTGDKAFVRVRVSEHPIPAMIGFETEIRFLYEDNEWKIDREKMLRSLER